METIKSTMALNQRTFYSIIKFLGNFFKFKAEVGQINKNLIIEF